MANFLEFIKEDIEAKKTLLGTMPTKNKRDIKGFNQKVDTISKKYLEYKKNLKKYLQAKNRSFKIKEAEKDLTEIKEKIKALEYCRFILNPTNTYYEKMGFDTLLYKISNYSDFQFQFLNEIINEFLTKFELAGIRLSSDDFKFTYYVHEYMNSFFERRIQGKEDYDKLSDVFERIYWVNPEIIGHIELNFRQLIKKNQKNLTTYIEKLKKTILEENNFKSYEDCLKKLKEAYLELKEKDREDIYLIVDLALKGSFDINDYFEDSRIRMGTYSDLSIDSLNFNDQIEMKKFYDNLEKLRINLIEYNNYMRFIPLFEDFKNQYEKQALSSEKDIGKAIKNIETQIGEKEKQLEKINRRIFKGDVRFFEWRKPEVSLKQAKIESLKIAQELYVLYQKHDQEFFHNRVLLILNKSLTILELLNLFYSFDYFKKSSLKRVFELTNYEEVIKYSDEFNLFAKDLTNVVINGVTLFEENNIPQVIVNKYRLNNINLTEEFLEEGEIENLLNKICFLLRINQIEKSSLTVEKIWFIVQMEKIKDEEEKAKK
ncbi:MAG: hypothetical protein ACOXZR_02250 [Bacilli bacterium]|jgi:hypothetical protein